MRTRLTSLLLAALVSLLGVGVVTAGTPDVVVEGGAYFDFVAPDPLGPTDGSIRFGFSGTVETIAADAELVPPADTNLAFIGGGTPTCLEVTREGGVITRLAFVAECTVSGEVILVEDIFGPDADGYLIADRLAAPAEFVTTVPEFAVLIGIPADPGSELSVTFTLDLDLGFPVSFVGLTSITGPVELLDDGDIDVGGGHLPTEVIDDDSRAALTEAAELAVDATVDITGNGNLQVKSDVPELDITLSVNFTAPEPSVAPSVAPNPTAGQLPDTRQSSAAPGNVGWAVPLLLGALVAASGSLAAVRVSRRR